MGLAQTLFGFRGRISRRTWWLWMIPLVLGMLAAVAIVFIHVGKDNMANVVAYDLSSRSVIALLVVYAIGNWIAVALSAKRLHDRDIRGFWAAIPTLIAIAIVVVQNRGHGGTMEHPSTAINLLSLASAAFSLWLLVVCGFLKGTQGPNRWGPDPLGPTA
jgi:uncharacterized membrane protein YhaH (DUF805 family)